MHSHLKLYITLLSSDIKITIKCIEAEIVLISLNSCLAIMVACKVARPSVRNICAGMLMLADAGCIWCWLAWRWSDAPSINQM